MSQVTGSGRRDSTDTGEPDPRRRARVALAGVAAGCVLLTVGGLSGCGAVSASQGHAVDAFSTAVAGQGTSMTALPRAVATPRVARLPKRKHKPAPSSSATATPTAAKSGGPATRPASGPAPSPSSAPAPAPSPSPSPSSPVVATPPAGPGDSACTKPSFVTSAQFGMWNLSPYFVYNDMWGINGYSVAQTLSACSFSDWYVVATMNNDNGDGHVKTYPNAQKDFDEPAISSLSSVTSTFADTSPGTGIYEDAYDIWLNGVATSGSTEVMIWTNNHGQRPAGSVVGTATIGGSSYTVWKVNNYIAFVADTNVSSGTMDLLAFFKWIMAKGWIPGTSTLGQVCYGVELVSTNGTPATFTFSNYAVNAS